MATFNPTVGTPSSLTVTGLSTLASATYVRSDSAYNFNTNKPMNAVVQVEVTTTNTPTGNKQVCVFLQESLDGTNFRSGPSSGSTATREPNLLPLGVIPLTTASTQERATFDVLSKLGYIPHSAYVVLRNDLGVALTAAAVSISEISGAST